VTGMNIFSLEEKECSPECRQEVSNKKKCAVTSEKNAAKCRFLKNGML
jgi:hypothetical protein